MMIPKWSLHQRSRLLFGGISAVVVLAVTPMFGSILAGSSLSPLAGIDHIGSLCLIALHFLLAPVYYVLQGMLAIGVLYAIWDRVKAWSHMRRVVRQLPARHPGQESVFSQAAARAGLNPSVLYVVDGLANPAFTLGFLWPRVYVAGSLEQQLTFDELTAVLKHEAVHVDRRDPLRFSILRFFACTLFWIPVLQRLAHDVADEAELQADARAAGDTPLILASAILALARWGTPDVATAVGFTRYDLLTRRIKSLVGEPAPAASHANRGIIVSAAVAVLFTWGVGTVVSHPLPHMSLSASHSFRTNWECLYPRMTVSDHICPHQQASKESHLH